MPGSPRVVLGALVTPHGVRGEPDPRERAATVLRTLGAPLARKSRVLLRTPWGRSESAIPHQGAKFALLRPYPCQWRRWVRQVRNRA